MDEIEMQKRILELEDKNKELLEENTAHKTKAIQDAKDMDELRLQNHNLFLRVAQPIQAQPEDKSQEDKFDEIVKNKLGN